MNTQKKKVPPRGKLTGNLAKRQEMELLAEELSFTTHFNDEECLALLITHDNILERGKLDRGRFREFLHCAFDLTSDLMLDLMFRAFDRNADGNVDQLEFVNGMSQMIRGDMEELTEFCYFVYDMNGDRSLAREELHQCLKGCFQVGFGLEMEDIEDAEKEIVDIAMKKLDFNRDGLITFDDFRKAVKSDPLLVIACGECLPAESCLARFLYTITDDYHTFTETLLGDHRHRLNSLTSTRRGSRVSRFISQAARLSVADTTGRGSIDTDRRQSVFDNKGRGSVDTEKRQSVFDAKGRGSVDTEKRQSVLDTKPRGSTDTEKKLSLEPKNQTSPQNLLRKSSGRGSPKKLSLETKNQTSPQNSLRKGSARESPKKGSLEPKNQPSAQNLLRKSSARKSQ